jgi:hypothetical protein
MFWLARWLIDGCEGVILSTEQARATMLSFFVPQANHEEPLEPPWGP